MQKFISNHNHNHLLVKDLKSKSSFKNLISNRDFKSFDFKSYPTLELHSSPHCLGAKNLTGNALTLAPVVGDNQSLSPESHEVHASASYR